jgi:two-component system, response regulator
MEKRILLVEDNADDIELSFRLFEKVGIETEVQVARDGEEALEFASRMADSLKLILLDLGLPKISGKDVLLKLQTDKRTRSIPVAILTITGHEQDTLLKEPFHVSAYLRKPIEVHDFLNLYRSCVGDLPTSL